MKRVCRCGQTAVEYIISLCVIILISTILFALITGARRSAGRTQALVGSDYP
jgi:hypothetical protein